MSRAEEVRARYEAELAVADLEDRLVAAKEAGEPLAELKLELRAARQEYRLQREGAATVNPATVEVSAEVSEV